MKKFRAVIVGAGAIARDHARVLRHDQRTELAGIADIDYSKAQSLASASYTVAYADYKTMVSELRPDIAIITLPHFLHKSAAIDCIERGCHVLMEKPMALNVEECAEMNAAARKRGVYLAVGHIQQHYAANRKAKEIIASGQLGQLVSIFERRHNQYFLPERPDWFLDKARSGGGVMINLGSHCIDKLQWIGGSPVTKVKASLTYHGTRGNVEGSGSLLMQTAAGVSAMISICGYKNVPVNETEFLGTEGQLKLIGSNSLWIAGEDRAYTQVELGETVNVFDVQWSAFLDDIEGNGPMDNSGEYGQSVCAVIDAIYRSDATGTEQDVITVPSPNVLV
ncbi:Gfo/Idh/MocA family protein [Paenibacillus ginsengarvi]|uniref:Gfo/Idh/MocA family oxidoreductase n=1 Tax=Paenibacillus ginsengarvi TaxID=400777 RepID=A0A3B0CQL5_9BACL|nr:Gfo/Idh/MocA family oxidoreductase [Paenibacillus ginsengarvi]RKN86109.1 gfo/Idh/MocA family oxidoreductase [Paenibacillus ginsengarvi]